MTLFRKAMLLASGSLAVLFVYLFFQNTYRYHTNHNLGKAGFMSLFTASSHGSRTEGFICSGIYLSGYTPKWNINYVCVIISFVPFHWPRSLIVFCRQSHKWQNDNIMPIFRHLYTNFLLKICHSWAHKYRVDSHMQNEQKQFLGNAEILNRKGENLDLDNWAHLSQWNLPQYPCLPLYLPNICFLLFLDFLSWCPRSN